MVLMIRDASRLWCAAVSKNYYGGARWHRMRSSRHFDGLAGTNSIGGQQSRFKSIAAEVGERSGASSVLGYEAHVKEGGAGVVLGFPTSKGTVFSHFHAPWLWSNNPSHVHPTSGQRTRTPGQYNGARIVSAELLTENLDEKVVSSDAVKPIPSPPRGCSHPIGTVFEYISDIDTRSNIILCVKWEPEPNDEDFIISYYQMEWLREWRYDEESLQQRRNRSEITAENALRRTTIENDGLIYVDYDILTSEGSDETKFEVLHALVRDGATLVKNAPPIVSGPFAPVEVVGRALAGSLSHGALYGNTFHVQAIPDAHNIAYTSVPLQPHQDLAYYESVPGLQLLHCVENNGVLGGESVLVDCFAAADHLRKVAPKHFETLVKCPATFVKQREGADMIYRRPHIVLQDGSSAGSIDGEIVTVTWSPPFEGPLRIPQHDVEDYYEAYAAFERMLDNSLPLNRNDDVLSPYLAEKLRQYADEHTWERQLQPGELLVFNNRRMLHGRRGFSMEAGTSHESYGRHLVGGYTNIDDTFNQYRVLLRNKHDRSSYTSLNFGNGTSAGV